MLKRNLVSMICVCAVVLWSGVARAALLVPGGTQFPAIGEANPSAGATLLASTGAVAFASPGNFSGTLTSSVFNNDTTNPFGLGAMTFVYVLHNDAGSANNLARLTMDSYGPFQTDASYEPGVGVVPTSIDRLLASTVGFNFSQIGPGPIPPGATSVRLVVQTDATAFAANAASVIDSGQVSGILSFGPIPEPSALGLLAFAGLAMLRRR